MTQKCTVTTSGDPELRQAILEYYSEYGRDLPWRRTSDPYAVWVSEVMLQQTQVKTVVPRYAKFLARYPTVVSLASATEEQVCEEWAGLGYYRRARHLHRGAVEVQARWGGSLPQTARELEQITGIGRYTAGAIASIAFGEAAPLVDGNVIRLLTRLFAWDGDPERQPLKGRLWARAAELVKGERPGDLNQGLMELGATICTPQQPRCAECPVRTWCEGYRTGAPTQFPSIKQKAAVKSLSVIYAWVTGPQGVWLEPRPVHGLWAGLWEPPSVEGTGGRRRLEERLGARLGPRRLVVQHRLTHRDVTAKVYRASGCLPERLSPKGRFFSDPLAAPLSGLSRKVVQALWEADGPMSAR